MMTRYFMRWIGLIVLAVSAWFRLHATRILPDSYSWSGDFWTSPTGVFLSGFCELCMIGMFSGELAFVLSFTTLVRETNRQSGDWKSNREQSHGT